MHRDDDQCHAIPAHGIDQRMTGAIRIAGLPADRSRIIICRRDKERIVARKLTFCGRHVRWRDRVGRRIDDDPEIFPTEPFLHDERHIVSRCHVFRIRHAAGIRKMRTRASELRCPVIHHLDKIVDRTAADIFSKLRRHIVRRVQESSVDEFFDSELLPDFRIQVHTAGFRIAHAGLRHRDPVLQIASFKGKKERHDFRDRRRSHRCPDRLVIEYRPGIRVDQTGCK